MSTDLIDEWFAATFGSRALERVIEERNHKKEGTMNCQCCGDPIEPLPMGDYGGRRWGMYGLSLDVDLDCYKELRKLEDVFRSLVQKEAKRIIMDACEIAIKLTVKTERALKKQPDHGGLKYSFKASDLEDCGVCHEVRGEKLGTLDINGKVTLRAHSDCQEHVVANWNDLEAQVKERILLTAKDFCEAVVAPKMKAARERKRTEKEVDKPCPFCGSLMLRTAKNDAGLWVVHCVPCRTEGPAFFYRQDAMKMWNERRPAT